jgi:uncharacterized protein (DUF983 family)
LAHDQSHSGQTTEKPKRLSALTAVLRARCPRCRVGRIFNHGQTNQRCPYCDLSFSREQGYFVGALYFSYFISACFMIGFFFAGCWLRPDWPREWLAGLAIVLFIPLAPMVSRFSRVLWVHYDRWAWPGEDWRH